MLMYMYIDVYINICIYIHGISLLSILSQIKTLFQRKSIICFENKMFSFEHMTFNKNPNMCFKNIIFSFENMIVKTKVSYLIRKCQSGTRMTTIIVHTSVTFLNNYSKYLKQSFLTMFPYAVEYTEFESDIQNTNL